MKILAFDYGASSGRAILGKFDGNKLSLEETHRFGSDPVMVGSTFTWDILRLYHEMKKGVINTVLQGHKDIVSIGVDTWGVDFGLLSKDGQLLGNPVHYRDTRTDGMMEKAFQTVSAKEIYETTGIAFQKFNTLYQLLAMKESGSPLLDAAETFLFVPDLFNYFLTGEKFCEYTITSTSQLYDPRKGAWAFDMMKKFGLRTDIFPEVIPVGTKIGNLTKNVCDELGVNSVPVIAVAEHDTGSAVVSVPFAAKGAAFLSSGTWSLLGVELDKPIINDKVRELNYTNEGGINNNV
jgi:sugar (pentulose or hexulose) kinase